MLNNEIQKQDLSNFSLWNFFKTKKRETIIIVICSFFYAFASTSLLTRAASIPSGLSAISLTLSLIIPTLKPYLTLIYLLLNIPLICYFWKKVKKSYIVLTLFFLTTNAFFGFIIAFDFGSLFGYQEMSIDYWLSQNVIIFCPPTNENELAFAKENNIKNLMSIAINDYYDWLFKNDLNNNDGVINGVTLDQLKVVNGMTIGVQKGWPIFIYTFAAVVLSASVSAIAWKFGASTGGTDIIVYYISTKLKKAVGNLLMIIGLAIACCSLILLWSLATFGSNSENSIKYQINGFTNLIGLQTISSAIYIILFGKILNMIYPKYEKVVIKVDTVNVELFKTFFSPSNFNHPYKIHTLTSGKTGENIYTFETVVLLLESEELIKNIKSVDPTAWVSKLEVKKIYGGFDYSKVE